MSKRSLGVLCSLLSGCAAGNSAPQRVPAASTERATLRATAPAARAPAPVSRVSASEPAEPRALALTVTRVLSVRVDALALRDGTRVAVLADAPYVGDARGLRPLPLPEGLRAKAGEVDELGIYFGRDNEPRIMGSRRTSRGEVGIYLRHLPSGWRDGREEIGQLGGARAGALWGVLGSADPELVCRAGAQCIIKRQSGWTSVPAGASQRLVTLQDGVLWGLDLSGVSGIDARGWTVSLPAPTPPWPEPRAFWATRGAAWVSSERSLFHSEGGAWAALASPVGEPAAIWGARPDSLWVVGSTGAAHYDGQRFRPVSGVPGALHVVRGRAESELWFGGDTGLYRAVLPPSPSEPKVGQ